MNLCQDVSDGDMADDPTYLDKKRGTLRARLMHWTAEVVLVFFGVSAAFWLNNYQQHEQEAKQRSDFGFA